LLQRTLPQSLTRWLVVIALAGLLATGCAAGPGAGSADAPGGQPEAAAGREPAVAGTNGARAEPVAVVGWGEGQSPAVRVAEQVGPAVVGIINERDYYDWFTDRSVTVPSSGSGVIIRSDGVIVTNNHVVQGHSRLSVILSDGRRLTGQVVGRDPYSDLAVVRVEAEGLPTATLGDSDRVRVGEWAIAIGNPLGMQFERSVTLGIVSGLNRDLEVEVEPPGGGRVRVRMSLIQTDAAINPGNSGGALSNARGEVIGINSIKVRSATGGVEGMGFAIPSNHVKRIVAELLEHGRVRYPWLGIQFLEADAAAYYHNVKLERGIFVASVLEDSPAARAGIRAGDALVSIGGQAVNSLMDLRQVLFRFRAGDAVKVGLLRDGREIEVQVTLGELPYQSGG